MSNSKPFRWTRRHSLIREMIIAETNLRPDEDRAGIIKLVRLEIRRMVVDASVSQSWRESELAMTLSDWISAIDVVAERVK